MPGVPDVRVGVAIPAAGVGRRMGGTRKAWLELDGRPLLALALEPFLARTDVTAVRVALSPRDAADPPTWLVGLDPRVEVVAGGATRAESVARAVTALPRT
ncbi:MAG: 2-C-methyl-D-erythritol 4-phosphate cytidylyltransferase, partial [Gemmatimonadetes bacterium]|nr:2-C-methyl-D-erythritol 4-phosphate cytidylyltransferase [Gemmatimonadota bacterium]NNK62146.1 NTP transferase domain-containing protein [Gemmatimonadota bacterium]